MRNLVHLIKQLSYYAKGDPRLHCDNITMYQTLRLAKRELKRMDQITGKVVIRTENGTCSIQSYQHIPESEFSESGLAKIPWGHGYAFVGPEETLDVTPTADGQVVINPEDLRL